jgi:hypothetical protein
MAALLLLGPVNDDVKRIRCEEMGSIVVQGHLLEALGLP